METTESTLEAAERRGNGGTLRLSCGRSDLLQAVQTVARAVSGRTTLPILGNVALSCREGQLELTATDLDIWMERTLPVEAGEQGTITVPARVLLDILSALPEAPVELEADERDRLHIACGRSRYQIHGLPIEEYPHLPALGAALQVEVGQEQLRDLIRMTAFAASRDETRAVMMGALLVMEPDKVRMVATDTYRLALRTQLLSLPLEESLQVVVPERALGELPRLLREEGTVNVAVAENQIQFATEEVRLTSRLLEGQFPNYEKVVFSEREHRWRLNTHLFREAVQRCEIVARENNHRLLLAGEDGTVKLEAQSDQVGAVQEEVPATIEGEPIQIAFNALYLLDLLKVLDTEEFFFDLLGATNPGAIRPCEGPELVYILMPMQM